MIQCSSTVNEKFKIEYYREEVSVNDSNKKELCPGLTGKISASSRRALSICFFDKVAKKFRQLIYPGRSFICIEGPLISKTKLTEIIIITIIQVPE